METELTIAGIGQFVLAVGHTVVGVRWVLPHLKEARLPGTPFGPPSFTLTMLRFTWYIVTVVMVGFGVVFLTLAWAPDANPRTLILRVVTAMLVTATVMALWQARRRFGSILRLPVPAVFVLIAAMCWAASS